MAKRPEDNIEFLTHICKFSRHGAMMQIFVLAAIENYAKACIKAGPEKCGNAMIHGGAWVGTAKEAIEEIERRSTPQVRMVEDRSLDADEDEEEEG